MSNKQASAVHLLSTDPAAESVLQGWQPILCVMFIYESGFVESWGAQEIRANPGGFKATMEGHAAAGRRPLVMRGNRRIPPPPPAMLGGA